MIFVAAIMATMVGCLAPAAPTAAPALLPNPLNTPRPSPTSVIVPIRPPSDAPIPTLTIERPTATPAITAAAPTPTRTTQEIFALVDQGAITLDEAAAELDGQERKETVTPAVLADSVAPTPTNISTTPSRAPTPTPKYFVDAAWISRLETRIHELTNEERTKLSINPLSYDPALAQIARRHSADMMGSDYFNHVNPAGQSPTDRATLAGYSCINKVGSITYSGIGENIIQAWRGDRSPDQLALDAVQRWMDSPVHRDNILWAYRREGIGVNVNIHNGDVLVTQNFC